MVQEYSIEINFNAVFYDEVKLYNKECKFSEVFYININTDKEIDEKLILDCINKTDYKFFYPNMVKLVELNIRKPLIKNYKNIEHYRIYKYIIEIENEVIEKQRLKCMYKNNTVFDCIVNTV